MFKFLEKIEQKKYLQLFFIAMATHILMLKNNFTNYSDDVYVLLNPMVKHLSAENIKLMFSSYFDGHYHPLTLLSLSLNYAMSGNNAISYNLTNLLLHCCNVVLIFVFIKQLFRQSNFAFVVALLWALHPLHVESVARITDRKDTQYVFFFLVALINYMTYKTTQVNKYLTYTVVAFVLSLLSKGQALVFPFVIVLIEWFSVKTENKKANYKPVLYFLPISILFAWLAYKAQLFTGYLSQTENISLTQIVFYPATILSNYIFKLFVPIHLSAQYTIPNIAEIQNHYYLLIIPIALVFITVYLFFKKNYVYVFGIIFYLITVSIMLRVIPIAENFMPDRYNYLPSLGFCIIVAQLYFSFSKNIKLFVIVKPLAYGYLLFFAATSFMRVSVWKDGMSIWQDAYKKYPNDTDVLLNLGSAYLQKQPANAVDFFSKAIQYDSLNILARLSLYNAYKTLLQEENANTELHKILNLKPQTANQFSNQAVVFAKFALYDKALQLNAVSIKKHPQFIKFQLNQISFHLYKMEFLETLKKIDELLSLHPYCANTLYEMRAKINMGIGNVIEAASDIEMAERTGSEKTIITGLKKTNNAIGSNQLAYSSSDFNVLIKCGKELYNNGAYVNAIVFFEKCNNLSPNNEAVLNNLCACYFNLSRPDKVKEYYAKINSNNFQRNPQLEKYLKDNTIND